MKLSLCLNPLVQLDFHTLQVGSVGVVGGGRAEGWGWRLLSEFRKLHFCLVLSDRAVALRFSLQSVLEEHCFGNVHSLPDHQG